eukprot:gnl/MRDRNA2_/MRDRNA2_88695_c0_seq1.p1 gnl/MRDRNA2_/MRDRNA2_88695_c0~~gnl/MRDRNA2_/MRDRNA2_88695_c0_seq1.p1  ORF type:complete len:530 (+),score=76.62 gnl/MRDRNA2_/MRDRNA2_88695_c0_seq1:99-1592(+)
MDANQMEEVGVTANQDLLFGLIGRSAADVMQHVQVVSLGSYCGVKATIRRLGLSEASLPFDWMRTTITGLIHWLKSDFDGFFRVNRRLQIMMTDSGLKMLVFRSQNHSFWHDNIELAADREKLWRRVRRFMSLSDTGGGDSQQRTLLFVRSLAGTQEISLVETLYEVLKDQFGKNGRKVVLLVIIENQAKVGPILHQRQDGIIFWVQPTFQGSLSPDGSTPAPYEDAVAFGISHILKGAADYASKGQHPRDGVYHCMEFLKPGGPHSLTQSTCGIWAAHVHLEGKEPVVLLAAFEGYDHIMIDHVGAERQSVRASDGSEIKTVRQITGSALNQHNESLVLKPSSTINVQSEPSGTLPRAKCENLDSVLQRTHDSETPNLLPPRQHVLPVSPQKPCLDNIRDNITQTQSWTLTDYVQGQSPMPSNQTSVNFTTDTERGSIGGPRVNCSMHVRQQGIDHSTQGKLNLPQQIAMEAGYPGQHLWALRNITDRPYSTMSVR